MVVFVTYMVPGNVLGMDMSVFAIMVIKVTSVSLVMKIITYILAMANQFPIVELEVNARLISLLIQTLANSFLSMVCILMN